MEKRRYTKRLGLVTLGLLRGWVNVPECAKALWLTGYDVLREIAVFIGVLLVMLAVLLMPFCFWLSPAVLWLVDRASAKQEAYLRDWERLYGRD